jgi:hypothetical protein
VWAAATLIGIAALSLPHIAPMPAQAREAKLLPELLKLRKRSGAEFLVHVIPARCSCTERLFAHLMKRGPFRGVEELVLFIGEDAGKERLAAAAGFRFTTVSHGDFATRFALDAAPVLFVFDANARLEYAGGYFDHPATIFARDERIVAELAAGGAPRPLPIYGCPVSAQLQASLDPLGILYPNN